MYTYMYMLADNVNLISYPVIESVVLIVLTFSSFPLPPSPDEPAITNIEKGRLTSSDFQLIEVIGRGAFGEVQLVRMKETNKVYCLLLSLSPSDKALRYSILLGGA